MIKGLIETGCILKYGYHKKMVGISDWLYGLPSLRHWKKAKKLSDKLGLNDKELDRINPSIRVLLANTAAYSPTRWSAYQTH